MAHSMCMWSAVTNLIKPQCLIVVIFAKVPHTVDRTLKALVTARLLAWANSFKHTSVHAFHAEVELCA